jgi:hypothetical protein
VLKNEDTMIFASLMLAIPNWLAFMSLPDVTEKCQRVATILAKHHDIGRRQFSWRDNLRCTF